jgi:translation initiation factor IF-3
MRPEDALLRAVDEGLDLVEVAPGSKPPVCRIMDYGRYKYEQKKKKSGANKKSHAATLKEVKMRPGTDMHDLEFKLENAKRFLLDGDKVKVTVMFRGREMVHQSRGRQKLEQVQKLLEPLAKVEMRPRMEGRFMSMILVGERDAIEAARKLAAEAEETSGNDEASVKAEAAEEETTQKTPQQATEPEAESPGEAAGD